jgi:hypothetical protein
MASGTSDPGPASSSALLSRVAAVRALEVPLARFLCASLRSGEPFGMLHGSLVDFGRSHGLGSSEVHRLVSVGFLLEKHPEVEALLLSARLSLENAAQLHDLFSVEGAVKDGEDWVSAACDLATADLL